VFLTSKWFLKDDHFFHRVLFLASCLLYQNCMWHVSHKKIFFPPISIDRTAVNGCTIDQWECNFAHFHMVTWQKTSDGRTCVKATFVAHALTIIQCHPIKQWMMIEQSKCLMLHTWYVIPGGCAVPGVPGMTSRYLSYVLNNCFINHRHAIGSVPICHKDLF